MKEKKNRIILFFFVVTSCGIGTSKEEGCGYNNKTSDGDDD